jgi:hypothetical protein
MHKDLLIILYMVCSSRCICNWLSVCWVKTYLNFNWIIIIIIIIIPAWQSRSQVSEKRRLIYQSTRRQTQKDSNTYTQRLEQTTSQ